MVHEPIKLLLVDAQPIVRAGVSAIFATTADMQVVGMADDGASALAMCGELRPDIVLMDIGLPDMCGLDAIEMIRGGYPQTRVVVLTTYQSARNIRESLVSGAISYLLKNIEPDALLNAVRLAAVDQPMISPEAMQTLVKSTVQAPPSDQLTDREREILGLTAHGLSNAEIAHKLGISRFTVKNHLSSVFDKLGVISRTEATTAAIRRGLVKID